MSTVENISSRHATFWHGLRSIYSSLVTMCQTSRWHVWCRSIGNLTLLWCDAKNSTITDMQCWNNALSIGVGCWQCYFIASGVSLVWILYIFTCFVQAFLTSSVGSEKCSLRNAYAKHAKNRKSTLTMLLAQWNKTTNNLWKSKEYCPNIVCLWWWSYH